MFLFFDLDPVQQLLDFPLELFLGLTVTLAQFPDFFVGPFGELSFQLVESLFIEFLYLLVLHLADYPVIICKSVIDYLDKQEWMTALYVKVKIKFQVKVSRVDVIRDFT